MIFLKILFAFLFLNLNPCAFAQNSTGNGGDPCEKKFIEISTEIKSWILGGGSKHLNLPARISLVAYNARMLESINHFSVSFTEDPILSYGVQKTCIPDPHSDSILCERQFCSLSEPKQYLWVHQELSNLAGIEIDNGVFSEFDVTAQLARFLKLELSWKLAIKPMNAVVLPTTSTCLDLYSAKTPNGKTTTSIGAAITTLTMLTMGIPVVGIPAAAIGGLVWLLPSRWAQYKKNENLIEQAYEYLRQDQHPLGNRLKQFTKEVNHISKKQRLSEKQVAQALIKANENQSICSDQVILYRNLAKEMSKRGLF